MFYIFIVINRPYCKNTKNYVFLFLLKPGQYADPAKGFLSSVELRLTNKIH
jgi:hypothetical protein